jgi:hypothetical protein
MLASDMICFLSITAVTLTAFASAFNVVLDTRGLLLFGLRLRACFMMMLGDINFEDFPSTAAPLVFFFVVLHHLQLVNMLIAKMGDTYSRITEEAEHRFWLERARICLAIEGEDQKAIVEDESTQYWITEGEGLLQKRMLTVHETDKKHWDREVSSKAAWRAVVKSMKKPQAAPTGDNKVALVAEAATVVAPDATATPARAASATVQAIAQADHASGLQQGRQHATCATANAVVSLDVVNERLDRLQALVETIASSFSRLERQLCSDC